MFAHEKYLGSREERILPIKSLFNLYLFNIVNIDYTKDKISQAEEFYRLGNQYRKEGNWRMAINNYLEAIELDPESPAVEAKKMLDDILNFYHKDAYNP